jgi:hypothetical protein
LGHLHEQEFRQYGKRGRRRRERGFAEAVVDGSGEDVARNREWVRLTDNVQRRLESILQEGYEGAGWTIFKSGRQLDKRVSTLTHALVEHIQGWKRLPGDELTFSTRR